MINHFNVVQIFKIVNHIIDARSRGLDGETLEEEIKNCPECNPLNLPGVPF